MKPKIIKQCDGCAFGSDTEASTETFSRFQAGLAVMTPFPFYCHESIPTFDDPNVKEKLLRPKSVAREMVQNEGWRICGGWKSRVKELAEQGFYKHNLYTRWFGRIIINSLALIKSGELSKKGKAAEWQVIIEAMQEIKREVSGEFDLKEIVFLKAENLELKEVLVNE